MTTLAPNAGTRRLLQEKLRGRTRKSSFALTPYNHNEFPQFHSKPKRTATPHTRGENRPRRQGKAYVSFVQMDLLGCQEPVRPVNRGLESRQDKPLRRVESALSEQVNWPPAEKSVQSRIDLQVYKEDALVRYTESSDDSLEFKPRYN